MSVPKIISCKPVGSAVLIEHLTDNEMMGTNLVLAKSSAKTVEIQQAYVLAVGPHYDEKIFGFKVGDRVTVSGSYNPLPKFYDGQRELGIVEPHAIRAILVEEDEAKGCENTRCCCVGE